MNDDCPFLLLFKSFLFIFWYITFFATDLSYKIQSNKSLEWITWFSSLMGIETKSFETRFSSTHILFYFIFSLDVSWLNEVFYSFHLGLLLQLQCIRNQLVIMIHCRLWNKISRCSFYF